MAHPRKPRGSQLGGDKRRDESLKLKTFVAPFISTRLTAPGFPRMYIASGLHLVVQPNPSEQTSHKPIENRPFSYSAWFDWHFASRKGIQDSLGFWIPHRGFRIPGTGFQYLSVELEIWIPILGRIPDSLSCILNSKAQDTGFHSKNCTDSGIRIPLHGARH